MKKIEEIKNSFLNWKDLSFKKVAKYISIVIGAVILLCVLIFIFFPDPFINAFVKERITKAFTEAYPAYSLKLGDMHYSVWKNRLGTDSLSIKSNDSTFSGSASSFSVSGISWLKILFQSEFSNDIINSTVIDAEKIVLNFHCDQNEIRCAMLHISVPDSVMVSDSIKYFPLISDEKLFSKSQFKQTRFRFDIPQLTILGLDYLELLKGNKYSARNININGLFADILVNMDKPYDVNTRNPQMPNEALLSMKEIIDVDSLIVTNGRLKYCERFAVGAAPGVISFNRINISVSGIANHSTSPVTTVIRADGIFMNSGKMKLFMEIPLTSKDFSLRYSGSLSKMGVAVLNEFIEPSEHQRIKSGIIHTAAYDVNVNSGHASGTLRVEYEDLTVALLNKETGSEKGIFNRILSFFGKVFVIRRTNMPDEDGKMKIGEINYTRNHQDYFLQFLWFALRGSIAHVVGFPRE